MREILDIVKDINNNYKSIDDLIRAEKFNGEYVKPMEELFKEVVYDNDIIDPLDIACLYFEISKRYDSVESINIDVDYIKSYNKVGVWYDFSECFSTLVDNYSIGLLTQSKVVEVLNEMFKGKFLTITHNDTIDYIRVKNCRITLNVISLECERFSIYKDVSVSYLPNCLIWIEPKMKYKHYETFEDMISDFNNELISRYDEKFKRLKNLQVGYSGISQLYQDFVNLRDTTKTTKSNSSAMDKSTEKAMKDSRKKIFKDMEVLKKIYIDAVNLEYCKKWICIKDTKDTVKFVYPTKITESGNLKEIKFYGYCICRNKNTYYINADTDIEQAFKISLEGRKSDKSIRLNNIKHIGDFTTITDYVTFERH